MAFRNGSPKHAEDDGIEELGGAQFHIDRSAVQSVHAGIADIERAAVQRLHATDASIAKSAIGSATFTHGTVSKSMVGVVAGRSVACDEVRTVILASPIVRGEVHTWLDLRAAVAIGVGIALGRALLAGANGLGRRVR